MSLFQRAFESSFPPLLYIHRNSTVKIESKGYLVPTWVKKPEFRFRNGIPKSKQALGHFQFRRIPNQKIGIRRNSTESAGIRPIIGKNWIGTKNGIANQGLEFSTKLQPNFSFADLNLILQSKQSSLQLFQSVNCPRSTHLILPKLCCSSFLFVEECSYMSTVYY